MGCDCGGFVFFLSGGSESEEAKPLQCDATPTGSYLQDEQHKHEKAVALPTLN